MLRYIIPGRPITKKNSQQLITVKGRRIPIPSPQYREYENAAGYYLRPKPNTPIGFPVNVKVLYYMPTRGKVDLLNLLGATLDILVKWGILADDNSKIAASHDGSRVLYDKANPRAEIYIEEVEHDKD